ncbi:MAG: FISUMP domain-containing protein [Bacteroidales bacterium]|nr:FISUMP domain-containing protein [Bacteroidales bacterium]
MKRIYSFIAAALTIISAASCVQELSHDAHHQDDAIVYTAIAEGADTKAVLGTSESGRQQFLWEDGDVIYINPGGGSSYMFSTSLTEPSAVADFVYQGTDGFQIQTGQPVIATYPFGSWVQMEYRYVLLPIPSAQQIDPKVESYNKLAVPVAAYSTDNSLHFKNTTALLKCQVSQANVTKIRFYGLNEEAVAGHSLVCFKENGEIDYVGIPNGNNEFYVELSAAPGKVFQSDRSYYLSVIPNTLESGFAVELYDSNDDLLYTKKYDRSITIKRNVILNLGMLGESSDIEPSADDYIDEYGINHGPGVEIDGVVWAPVNCGYHAEDFPWGKLYQWGRKYGQGYYGSLFDPDMNYIEDYYDAGWRVIESAPVSLEAAQSEGNESIFYKSTKEYNYNWFESSDYNLWNSGTEENPVKTEYDPCPKGWRVPTLTELSELTDNFTLTTDGIGRTGYMFEDVNPVTSEASQLFFPYSGYSPSNGYTSNYRGGRGYYWSSNLKDVYADYLIFYSETTRLTAYNRAHGLSVRCVQDDSELIPVADITINMSSMVMCPGTSSNLYATIAPYDANHQSAYWSSSDISVAIVDQAGNVTAVSPGNATITAMAGMKTATCEVTVSEEAPSDDYVDEYGINHGPGVEIDGVVWAPVNCGYHETDFKYGKLYQWGRKYGQGYSGLLYDVNGNNVGEFSDTAVPTIEEGGISVIIGQHKNKANVFFTGTSEFNYDWLYPQDSKLWNSGSESAPVKTEYDPCPEGWRVPTYAELDELNNNYSSWTTDENGQSGRWFSGPNSYTATVPQVFFPAAGDRSANGGNAYDRDSSGGYWSSRPDSSRGDRLFFRSSRVGMGSSGRASGYSVRCVKDEPCNGGSQSGDIEDMPEIEL